MEVLDYLKRKQEVVFVLITSIALMFLLIYFRDVVAIYSTNSLNPLILSIFGTLFGLLLTSYAILFGLIPALSIDTLETNALKSVNNRFFISLIINLMILILGISIIFFPIEILFYIQLFLVIFLLLMFFILILYLYLLFLGVKNKAIKSRR